MKRKYKDGNKLFFFSDAHLGHRNIIKENYDNRPYDSIEDMDKDIIDKIHALVPKDGILVSCGDLVMNDKLAEHYIKLIDRQIIHIRGNHDDIDLSGVKNVICSVDNITLSIKDPIIGSIKIFCSHYPHLVWNASHHNKDDQGVTKMCSLHLYGHVHHSLSKDTPMGQWYQDDNLVMDVGINGIGYGYNVRTYQNVIEFMTNKMNNINGLFV